MRNRRPTGRSNQRRRTRKDLLAAAARLLKRGGTPAMDEIAEEAAVSRATFAILESCRSGRSVSVDARAE